MLQHFLAHCDLSIFPLIGMFCFIAAFTLAVLRVAGMSRDERAYLGSLPLREDDAPQPSAKEPSVSTNEVSHD